MIFSREEEMPKTQYILPFITALFFAGMGIAQQDTTTSADVDATATEEAGVLSMGRNVEEDPTYIRDEYDDWQLRCFRSEADEDPCQMFQLLSEEFGNPIAEFSIFRLDEGGPAIAGATIVVPLMTLLTSELKLSVDGGIAKSYPYRFCSPAGCVAQIGLTAEDIDAMKRGATATLTLVPAQAPEQLVDIKSSLTGFTAAFDNTSVFSN